MQRVRWGLEFWRTPLFAGAAWSFGDSWATSVTPLTALAGGVLAASGAVAGLVPGVDLTRFGLLMALAGGLTTLAPLLFGAVNSLFPAKDTGEPAPTGEVVAARLWVMLLASCLTVFAIGAEIGFVGLVLGFDLIVASPAVRWIGPVRDGPGGGPVPWLRRALDPHPGRPAVRRPQEDRREVQLHDLTPQRG